jgi:hypothetical protein
MFYGFLHELDWRAFAFVIRNLPAQDSPEREAQLRNRGITVTEVVKGKGRGKGKGKGTGKDNGKGKNKGRAYFWRLRELTID